MPCGAIRSARSVLRTRAVRRNRRLTVRLPPDFSDPDPIRGTQFESASR